MESVKPSSRKWKALKEKRDRAFSKVPGLFKFTPLENPGDDGWPFFIEHWVNVPCESSRQKGEDFLTGFTASRFFPACSQECTRI